MKQYPLSCREEMRGKESKCNGGAYDGCNCGKYSPKELLEVDRRRKIWDK